MDTEKIKQVVQIFERSQCSSMNLECEEMKIQLEKENNAIENSQAVQELESEEMISLKSPLVGTFYCAPGPNQDPYVEIGQKVNVGDTLCILEAMKSMNEIKASQTGIVTDILVNDGDLVEYDQVLIQMRECDD